MEVADEPNEMEWLKASLNNSAFEYLRDLAVCRRSKHINNRESNVMPNG